MTDTAKIEPLRREYMEEVIEILQYMSVFEPPNESYDEIWNAFSAQTHVFSVVAIEHGKVIGYGSVVIEEKIRGGKMGHLEDIVTSPSRRNKGIGKAVVDALYDIAKQHGCYKVALQCQAHNVAFYEKCDYTVSGSAMQRFISP